MTDFKSLEAKSRRSIQSTARLLKVLSEDGSVEAHAAYKRLISELLADVSLSFRANTINTINDKTEVVVCIENPDYCSCHSQFPIRMIEHNPKTNRIILRLNNSRTPIEKQNVFQQMSEEEILAAIKYQAEYKGVVHQHRYRYQRTDKEGIQGTQDITSDKSTAVVCDTDSTRDSDSDTPEDPDF